MRSPGVFFLVTYIAIGVFCADWDIFQDDGSASSGTNLAFADTGALDPLVTNEDLSSNFNLDDLPPVTNSEDPFTLFNSGDLDALDNEPDSLNLFANVDDTCSLPVSRRMRARAERGTSCDNIYNSNNPLGASLDGSLLQGLEIPHYGRKITDYEDSNQRMTGQTFCPSQKIVLPGLIIPVCSSGILGFTQSQLMDVLYTVYNGFMSMLLFFSFLLLFHVHSVRLAYHFILPPLLSSSS